MEKYKGYKYPSTRELFADEEKYTNPDNPDEWKVEYEGHYVVFSKDRGTKEVFEDFINAVLPQSKIVSGAIEDVVEDSNNRNQKKLTELADKIHEEYGVDKVSFEVKDPTKPDINTLSDEEIDQMAEEFDEIMEKSDELKAVAELPSNNGVTERDPSEITEKGYEKNMNVMVDPNSGENKILGDASDLLEDHETFEDMVNRINSDELELVVNNDPLTEDEVSKYLSPDNPTTDMMINQVIDKDYPLSKESIKQIMQIANRRMKKEDFSIYKEFPDEVKEMIDRYACDALGLAGPKYSVQINTMKNRVAESLIDDFINNIYLDRVKTDFNKEIQNLFSKGASNVSEAIVGYSEDKIASYRKTLENIEDKGKRERLEKILDQIDDGYNLTSLKEYAKKCKIKRFDLEKPNKIIDRFSHKYKNSVYDTFSIQMAAQILARHLGEEYNGNDILAFFLAFCKQTTNYKSDNILHHSYMYYVTYNIVLIDINVSENTKAVSDKFLNNVREVINNLKERNKGVL